MPEASPVQLVYLQQMAEVLYDFLPATYAPVTFLTVAEQVGAQHFWQGGSKKPAITVLLTETFRRTTTRFPALLTSVVTAAVGYRQHKRNPLTRAEVDKLLTLALKLGHDLPEVRHPDFLQALSGAPETTAPYNAAAPALRPTQLADLLAKYQRLVVPGARTQEDGYAFEDFLQELFTAYGLAPREPFRNKGEQIDGSIEFNNDIYLIEARNQQRAMGDADLLVLHGRVVGHSDIGRGIYVTTGSFSRDGLEAFERKGRHRIICVDGADIWFLLEKKLPLDQVLRQKLRALVESGRVHLPVSSFAEDIQSMNGRRSSR